MQYTKLILFAIAALLGTGAHAQAAHDHAHDHGSHAAAPISAPAALTVGEVRKVDKSAGKLTLKHGEIRNLGMEPMTMVFRVQDGALLDQFKEGDKVNFAAEKIGGQLTVTKIEKAQ